MQKKVICNKNCELLLLIPIDIFNLVDIFLKLVIIYLGGILKWQEQKKTIKH